GDGGNDTCLLEQRGHPHATEHHRVHPLDGDHARLLRAGRAAAPDTRRAGPEITHHCGAATLPPERLGDPTDVCPDVVEPGRMQVDDANLLLDQSGRRGTNIAERHCADVTEVLGDDHIRTDLRQPRQLDLVDGEGLLEYRA